MHSVFPSFEPTNVAELRGASTLSWVPQANVATRADNHAAVTATTTTTSGRVDAFTQPSDLFMSYAADESRAAPIGSSTSSTVPSSCNVHNAFATVHHVVYSTDEQDKLIWRVNGEEDENSFTSYSFADGGAVRKPIKTAAQAAMTRVNKVVQDESLSLSENTLGRTASTQLLSTIDDRDSPVGVSNAAVLHVVPCTASSAESSGVCRVRSLPSKVTSPPLRQSPASHRAIELARAVPACTKSMTATSSTATPTMTAASSPPRKSRTSPNPSSAPISPPAALHCLSDTAETLAVVDPQRRKLLIPRSALSPTKGLLGRRSAPSLCLLYQAGRCHQGNNCYQVHADPEVVQQLRAEVESRPCCCAVHGDCNRSQWNPEKLSETVQGVTIHTVGTRIPLTHFAFTAGLEKLVQTNVGDPLGTSPSDYGVTLGNRIVLTANRDSVCRLHGAGGGCRFGSDCKFIHVCRELLASAETAHQAVSQPMITSPSQALHTPLVNSPFAMPSFQTGMLAGPQPLANNYSLRSVPTAPNPIYTLCPQQPQPQQQQQASLQQRTYYNAAPPMLNVSALHNATQPESNSPSNDLRSYYLSPSALSQQQAMGASANPFQHVVYMQQYDAATGSFHIVPVSLVQSA